MTSNKRTLWQDVVPFFHDVGLPDYTEYSISLPYGKIAVMQGGIAVLFIENCTEYTPAYMVSELQALARKLQLKPKIYITPISFNAVALNAYLQKKFQSPTKVHWFLKTKPVPKAQISQKLKIVEDIEHYQRISSRSGGSYSKTSDLARIKKRQQKTVDEYAIKRFFLVAKNIQNALVGIEAMAMNTEAAYLYNLAVLPKYRGSGFAQSIVGALTNKAFKLGVRKIFTAVYEDNKTSIRIHQRIGFKKFYSCQLWSC